MNLLEVQMSEPVSTTKSAFDELGFKSTVDILIKEIQHIYLADDVPWVIGYSGGKDSTATLQLVWMAVEQLSKEQRKKKVYVITNDTLVENPIVSLWVDISLETMEKAAKVLDLPIEPHKLVPALEDRFWVKQLGCGFPAPRPKFRWCTHRIKIAPTSKFIQSVVRKSGEAIVVLGTRSAESASRAKVLRDHALNSNRDHLNQHSDLPNAWIYPPIANWTNDDVWTFLMQIENAWGHSNKELLNMYRGATADGECPLVLDTNTPSCGSSRFGCWTCTLVEKDRSMEAMIFNDEEKEWMLPLLELRNSFDFRTMGERGDKGVRDFRRMSGKVQLYNGEPIHGPYKQDFRENLLKKLLEAQLWIQKHGPESVRNLELISIEELKKIRDIWVEDKHEVEDSLPNIYEKTMGKPFPDEKRYSLSGLGYEEMELLKDSCGDDDIHYQLVRELLHVEKQHSLMTRRSGLFASLEKALEKGFYADEDDAKQRAVDKFDIEQAVENMLQEIAMQSNLSRVDYHDI
ncbi:MAG: DNA phosphorothioation system sulfurtransferase DndC [Chlorobium sp.]|nr:DNA phosphorothioation system sulfurtransferase DndC [Chlorobium sp.]